MMRFLVFLFFSELYSTRKDIKTNIYMGETSGEFRKYSKFETYQEFMELIGNLGKCIKLSYTNILFDHRLTCMQTNINKILSVMLFQDLLMHKNLWTVFI